MTDRSRVPPDPTAWAAALVADLERVALRDRWGPALMAVGWVHLGSFLILQVLCDLGDRTHWHFVAMWFLEVAAVVATMRLVAGRGWHRASPLAGIIVRVWATFLILSFNLATLNELTGWTVDWFKPVWSTLATFGFATMAWLLHLRFLIPAVQMYFTGLLMVLYPAQNYLINGLSWWAALQVIGLTLERRRLRQAAPPGRPRPADLEVATAGTPAGRRPGSGG